MKRTYRKKVRAEKAEQTRRRILEVARRHLPAADELRMEEIAGQARVSVQTVYSHFGSKGGLFLALALEVMKETGAYEGLERVWRCKDGEAALRTFVQGDFDFCERAWDFIAFALRVRRTDPELAARFKAGDKSRLGHLLVVCRRLQEEGRLAAGLSVGRAARLAFSLTTPYVYEALVIEHGMPVRVARDLTTNTVVRALLNPDTKPIRVDRIDWTRLGLRALPSSESGRPLRPAVP
jgi:AcrR family transcriptional regulator